MCTRSAWTCPVSRLAALWKKVVHLVESVQKWPQPLRMVKVLHRAVLRAQVGLVYADAVKAKLALLEKYV